MNQPDEEAQNVRSFRRLFDEGFSGGNASVVDELVSPNLKEHMAMDPPSREGVKELIHSLHATFPDFRCELVDVVADGDKVWGRVRGGGTDRGGFAGHPPTGRTVATDSFDLCRFEGGRIVEHWGIVDRLGMMGQLGFVSSPDGSRGQPRRV
jgi:predicted ester cyclase